MKIKTEAFIKLLQERPPLWRKKHPEFANREVRNALLAQMAHFAGVDALECAKKMKNLKDSMRAQVKKLPETESGLPDFSCSDHITWPYYTSMLFMKNEFLPRKPNSQVKHEDINASETSEAEEDFSQDCEPGVHLDISSIQGASSSVPAMTNCDSWNGYSGNLKRRRPNPDEFDYEHRQVMARTDELDTFASDIANDLRKIKCPLKLMQAKAKIRRVAEEFALSELLVSLQSSAPPSPAREEQYSVYSNAVYN